MDIIQSSGFFSEFYLNIKNKCTDLEEFFGLQLDFDRISFINKLDAVVNSNFPVKREYMGKTADLSIGFKEKANTAFKNKKWIDAIILYSKSYIAMPANNESSEMAILLANRSAALFHMEKYEETLEDIDRSFSLGYPIELQFKLYERKARSLLAKKIFTEAIEAFKNTITSLDNSKQPLEKRQKMERDCILMIKTLESDKKLHDKMSKKTKTQDEVFKESLSASVDFDYNEMEGRFAKAKNNIQVGNEILVERPTVFALLEKFSKSHCQNCLNRTIIPMACPKCTDVIFCSQSCLDKALKTYHKYECGVLPIIFRSGASINCHMALRLIANKPLEWFLQIKSELDNNNVKNAKTYPFDDYRRVYNLVRHETVRDPSNFFQYSLMAHFLFLCLKAGGYMETSNNPNDDGLYIQTLIMRNLQFLQFNTHEIYELHESKAGRAIKTVFVGGGIYPTLALFNHSCDPGIVKYYKGTAVHVHAIKPIPSGQIIAENYGPLYTQERRDERKNKLKDLYWFDCNCIACTENWPRFEDMDNSIIRYRCDADAKCSNIIEVPANCNDFMVKCLTCGQFTNILKGLKVMQDTEMMDKTATRLYEAGNVSQALTKYIDLLKIMNEVLAPPFTDYCLCQQHIKDCLLHYGNQYTVAQ